MKNGYEKKKRFYILISIFFIIFSSVLFSQNVYAAVKINKSSVVMLKGETIKLKILGTKKKITWHSDKKKVAKVSSSGKVTAINSGNAIITAKVNGKKYKCKVKVEVPVISETHLSCYIGDKKNIKIEGCNHSVIWNSSNKNVATVKKGSIVAKNMGTTIISASVHGAIYKCNVTVKASFIELDCKKKVIDVGESVTLSLKEKKGFSNLVNEVKWSTLDSSIATVSNGIVTGIRSGKTTIIARYGVYRAICNITVKGVKSISLSKSSIILYKENIDNLSVIFNNYESEDDKIINWSTSEKAIATVDDNGKVTAISEGTAFITATCDGCMATCQIIVLEKKIILSKSIINLNLSDIDILTVGYLGFNNIDNQKLFWTSANPDVAIVNSGVVSGVGTGSTIITVQYGEYSDVCVVYVDDIK